MIGTTEQSTAALRPSPISWAIPLAGFAWLLALCLVGGNTAAFSAITSAKIKTPGRAVPAAPSALVRLAVWRSSRLELRGDATIGSWSCKSRKVRGHLTLAVSMLKLAHLFGYPSAPISGNSPIPKFPIISRAVGQLSVSATGLRGNHLGMDRDIQRALKAKQHPVIRYQYVRMLKAILRRRGRTGTLSLSLHVLGKLTLAGVTRRIHTRMLVRRNARGEFIVHASSVVFMRDFGVIPPTAFFGVIRGRNLVHVIFDLTLVPTTRKLHH